MRQLVITKQITNRSAESVNRYFQEINRYPMISAEEEVELAIRIRSGDTIALEQLVVANLRFVVSVAKQYQNQGLSFSDLINEGNLGLVRAAQKFDETRGFKFISYAVWWIRQSISQAISEHNRIVRLPINRLAEINKIARAIPYLEQEFEREPTNDELADYLDINSDSVQVASENKSRHTSFDKPLSTNGESDFSLYDIIKTDTTPTPDYLLNDESISQNITRILNKVSKKEADILSMSYGLGESQVFTLHDIAAKYGMTSERIRQIRKQSLRRLKNILKDNHDLLSQLRED